MVTDAADNDHRRLTQRAAELPIDPRAVIDAVRTDCESEGAFDVVNPASGALVATLADAGKRDVDRAVASARKAFENGGWPSLPASARARVLRRFAELVESDAETLGLLDTVQMGMPVSASIPGIAAAADALRVSADLAESHTDQLLPGGASALYMQVRRPRGVVAAITPWNFPVHVALAKIAPALAMGNSVILKPSEIAPLACLRLAELAAEAGVPPGVLNALPGTGERAGKSLALHMDVDCLAFVGSTQTGLKLMQYAGQSNMKALLLECGGKSPQIVLDDLGDPEGLCDALVQGFTWNSGQVCVSGSRLLLASSVYNTLRPILEGKVRALAIGDPFDPGTTLAPLSSAMQASKVRQFVEDPGGAAECIASGRDASGSQCAVAPHLFEVQDPSARLVQEEIFGPVGTIMRFDTPEQATALANGTRYGLSATIWSADLAQAHRIAGHLRAGFVMSYARTAPADAGVRFMSGEPRGMSGFGADGGALGLLSYTAVQAVAHHL